MRSYGDLDLLVRQRDIRRATELMIAAGYQAAVPLRAIDAGKNSGQYLFSIPIPSCLSSCINDFTLRTFPAGFHRRILCAANPRAPRCS